MIRDPDEIRRLAPLKEAENWRFRSFVRMLPRRRLREINRLAEQFGREAEAQMDCRTCGACCRDNWIPVSGEEAARLASSLSLPVLQFRRQFLVTDEEGEAIDARPCPFLSGNLCSVYSARPDACRGYPYIGGDIASRMLDILERAQVCPIVFDMLERLKSRFGFAGPVQNRV